MRKLLACVVAAGGLLVSLECQAQGVGRLVGKWNNDKTGENIVVEPDALGGWQFWSSDFGQGRISSASYEGANVKVEGRGLSCYYLVTLTAGHKMNWQIRAGTQGCLTHIFTKAE